MPKLALYTLAVTFLSLSPFSSCRKVYDFIRDHPDAHDTPCRITGIYYGNFDPATVFTGSPTFGITYNSKGNPVDMLLLHQPTLFYALEQHFRYDSFDRLTDFILNYAGGPDTPTYVPSAILWHKYAYPRPGIITDTFLDYTTSPINGPAPIAPAGNDVYLYKFDAAGKMIATASTSNTPNQPPPVFSPIAYDARGNNVLSNPDVIYDNSVNIYRTNKVWQLVYGNYSRNNPTHTGVSPTNRFGLPTVLPIIYTTPSSDFFEYFQYATGFYIQYACSAPTGPIDY